MTICRSSGACEIWMIECYKYSAPLALRSEYVDSNDFFICTLLSLYGCFYEAIYHPR
jgi:hypothetical protein